MKKILSISLLLIIFLGLTACIKSTKEAETSLKTLARNGEMAVNKDIEILKKYLNDKFQEKTEEIPQILEITKFLKSCLEKTEDKSGAESCRDRVLALSKEKGEEVKKAIDETIFKYWSKVGNWDNLEKDEILTRLENLIKAEANMIKDSGLLNKFR